MVVRRRKICRSTDGRGDRVFSNPERAVIHSAETKYRTVEEVNVALVIFERAQMMRRAKLIALIARANTCVLVNWTSPTEVHAEHTNLQLASIKGERDKVSRLLEEV